MFSTTTVHHAPSCGHYAHVGTCPSCQRRQLDRAKNHVVQSIMARQRWEAEQANLSVREA